MQIFENMEPCVEQYRFKADLLKFSGIAFASPYWLTAGKIWSAPDLNQKK